MKNKINLTVTKKQCAETGMVMVVLSISAGLISDNTFFYFLSLGSAIVSLLVPKVIYPIALLWFGLAKIIGAFTSRILLTAIFFLIVTPVGLFRKGLGKDSLNLKKFKKGSGSVFHDRHHRYASSDMVHLF